MTPEEHLEARAEPRYEYRVVNKYGEPSMGVPQTLPFPEIAEGYRENHDERYTLVVPHRVQRRIVTEWEDVTP